MCSPLAEALRRLGKLLSTQSVGRRVVFGHLADDEVDRHQKFLDGLAILIVQMLRRI